MLPFWQIWGRVTPKKKGQILAAFWALLKNVTFDFTYTTRVGILDNSVQLQIQ